MDDLELLKYPIGKFIFEDNATPEIRAQRINEIAAAPAEMRKAVEGLTDAQLDTPYRPGGWTVRQSVHHTADASMTLVTRIKLALTEQQPTVKTFEENDWAELIDSKALPVEPSLQLLDGLHARADALLRSMPQESFSLTFMHPASGVNKIDKVVAYLAWHSRQHTAHINALREREGW